MAVGPRTFGARKSGYMFANNVGWALVSRETRFHVKPADLRRCAVRAGNVAILLHAVSV